MELPCYELLVTHKFGDDFVVPKLKDLGSKLGMRTDYDVSIVNEFAQADLGDKRLNQRLVKVATALARQPQASIPKATGNWGKPARCIVFWITPPSHRTVERAAGQPTVLAVADKESVKWLRSYQALQPYAKRSPDTHFMPGTRTPTLARHHLGVVSRPEMKNLCVT